jgi:hypothetical protein
MPSVRRNTPSQSSFPQPRVRKSSGTRRHACEHVPPSRRAKLVRQEDSLARRMLEVGREDGRPGPALRVCRYAGLCCHCTKDCRDWKDGRGSPPTDGLPHREPTFRRGKPHCPAALRVHVSRAHRPAGRDHRPARPAGRYGSLDGPWMGEANRRERGAGARGCESGRTGVAGFLRQLDGRPDACGEPYSAGGSRQPPAFRSINASVTCANALPTS